MISRIRHFARQYPYLAVCSFGFCVMSSPIILLTALMPPTLFLESGCWLSIPAKTAMIGILQMCLSAIRSVLTPLFVSGFVIMNLGWIMHCRHRKSKATSSLLTTFVSCLIAGSLSAAEPVYPLTAATGAQGSVYVSDLRLPGLWKIDEGKGTLFFQVSPKFRTPLNAVRCVRLDRKQRVLACDSSTREIYRFDDQGQPQGLTKGQIGIPMDVVENADGDFLASDLETHRIWKIPAAGGNPVEFAAITAPRGLALDSEQRLWVVSHGKNQIVRILPNGTVETVVEGKPFQFPHEILVNEDGYALVSDGYAKAIWKVSPEGKTEQWIHDEPLQNPVGLSRHGDVVLIVDSRAKTVFQADAEGKLTVFWSGKEK